MEKLSKSELIKQLKEANRVYTILAKTMQELDTVIKEMEKRFKPLDTE